MKKFFLLFYSIYSTFSYGQNVGIGTTTPTTKLTVHAPSYGVEHTDGLRSFSTYLSSSGVWIGSKSNHPLHFYTNDGGIQMTLNQTGQLGIGTTAPEAGYKIEARGFIKSEYDYTHIVARATGGTNAWARFYMQTPSQGWFIGTSQNYNGNQLYIGDAINGDLRLTIQPGGGPFYMHGNITQNLVGYGLPKAMVYLNANGTIGRCYNGLNGSTVSGCGFSSVRISAGNYQVNFPFELGPRFFSITPQYGCCTAATSVSYRVFPPYALEIGATLTATDFNDYPDFADMPVMIIVY